MRRHVISLVLFAGLACVGLSGCQAAFTGDALRASTKGPCSPDANSQCFFRNSPIKLQKTPVRIEGRDLTFFPLADDLEFIDNSKTTWIAPKGTLTDGASIPTVLIPVVGAPTGKTFANAAAMHDAYCGIGNEAGPNYHTKTWQATHRLFYDALIAGGTSEMKAKLMYSAVWLGGPRWMANSKATDRRMERLPATLKKNALRETRFYIARSNPSMSELDTYLDWKLWEMERIAYRSKG